MRNLLSVPILAVGCLLLVATTESLLFADDPAPRPTTTRVSDLLSMPVYGTANEKLGKVEDLVLDPTSGKIRYAVLSFGGILGMGDKYFAVPWGDVGVFFKGATSAGTQKIVYCTLDVSKEALKNAPGFDKSQWPDFADATFANDIDRFYGSNRTASKIQGQTR